MKRTLNFIVYFGEHGHVRTKHAIMKFLNYNKNKNTRNQNQICIIILLVTSIALFNILLITWIPIDSNNHIKQLLLSSNVPDEEKGKTPTSLFSSIEATTAHWKPTDGFAACLLLKDDTSKLSEWLAYHWLTLPLKYLIVGIDPTSTTNPQPILELWNTSHMGIEIILWNDVDYHHWINRTLDELHRHRSRQKHLYSACMKYYKDRNRTFVILIDADEFITYNLLSDDDNDGDEVTKEVEMAFDNDEKEEKSTMIQEIDVEYFRQFSCPEKYLTSSYILTMAQTRRELTHTQDQYRTLWDYLQNQSTIEPWYSESACHLISRLFFSSIEDHDDDVDTELTSTRAMLQKEGFDVQDFSTLRYFHHANEMTFAFNNYGKVMIDLSKINPSEITRIMSSIHRPLPCTCLEPVRPFPTSILKIHHYIGSWEQYSARSDVRRSREVYDKFASVDQGRNYDLVPWLQRFIDIVGVEKSHVLLESAGHVVTGTVPLMELNPHITLQAPQSTDVDKSVECIVYYYYDSIENQEQNM